MRVPQSPLELRQAQSRTFETADTRLVLKAALNVLQDQGFVIRHADAELGIVTAVVEWRSRQPNRGLRVLKWVAAVPTYGASLLIPSGRTEFSADRGQRERDAGGRDARACASASCRE